MNGPWLKTSSKAINVNKRSSWYPGFTDNKIIQNKTLFDDTYVDSFGVRFEPRISSNCQPPCQLFYNFFGFYHRYLRKGDCSRYITLQKIHFNKSEKLQAQTTMAKQGTQTNRRVGQVNRCSRFN
jgi:hypothetical protein